MVCDVDHLLGLRRPEQLGVSDPRGVARRSDPRRTVGRASLKILDVGSIVFFAVLSLLAIFLDRADLDWVEDYSQTISSGALAVIALDSLAFTPFTEQYARETTPREGWDQPGFRRANFVLTAMGRRLRGQRDPRADRPAGDSSIAREWLNWIIPIVLVVGAFKYTPWYAAQARARRAGASAPA